MNYIPSEIEPKWQKEWEKSKYLNEWWQCTPSIIEKRLRRIKSQTRSQLPIRSLC